VVSGQWFVIKDRRSKSRITHHASRITHHASRGIQKDNGS